VENKLELIAAGFGGAAEGTQRSEKGLRQLPASNLRLTTDKWIVQGHWIGLAMVLIVLGMASIRLSVLGAINCFSCERLSVLFFPLGVLLQTLTGATDRAPRVIGSALVLRLCTLHGVRTQSHVPRKQSIPC